MPYAETLRAFIAVPLSSEVRQELRNIQQQIRRSAPDCIRWVEVDAIHLTLQFLGDVLTERVGPIQEALSVVARNVQPFDIQVKGLGAFPNTRRPRVVWVGITDQTSWLALLQQAVAEAMTHLGFQPDARAFSPHLTLGRVKRDATAKDTQELGAVIEKAPVVSLGAMRVAEMILFQSTLRPTGANYTPLARFSF